MTQICAKTTTRLWPRDGGFIEWNSLQRHAYDFFFFFFFENVLAVSITWI